MKKDNELLEALLRSLEDPEADGKALQQLAGTGEGFGPEFADRVTAAAFDSQEEAEDAAGRNPSKGPGSMEDPDGQGLTFYMPRMFRWVAITGAAAALVLLILAWSRYNVLDADAIAGLSELSIDDVFAENLF
jgi:hypothetical protein